MRRATPAVWQDAGKLSIEWDSPNWTDRYTRRTRMLASMIALVLLVGVLGLAGAYKDHLDVDHIDWRTPVLVGSTEVSFHRASVREDDNEVVLEASCRLVDDRPDPVPTQTVREGLSAMVHGRMVSRENRWVQFGPNVLGGLSRDEIVYQGAPVPCYLSLKLARGSQPPAAVTVLVHRMKWNDGQQAQLGGPGWQAGRPMQVMQLPVTVLTKKKI